jgi:hypothetical protein
MAEATETCSRAGVRWYLKMAEAGIQRPAAVQEYVAIWRWLKLQRRTAVREYVGI